MTTIATIGPKKYEFQDLVCLDFVLKTEEEKDISFLIEPHGGEDAAFTYKGNDGALKKFEVQVKGAMEAVTLNFVAECLLHFPDRRHENCLFERLIKESNLCVVLVMSGRATDQLLKYLPTGEWDLSPHKHSFTLKDAKALNLEFQSLVDSFGGTKLKNDRKEHTQRIIKNFNVKEVRDALKRLIIIDNERENLVKENIHISLRSRYHIPDDYFEEVIRKSSEYIKAAKESQENVIAKITQYLKNVSSVSLRPSNYIQRGDENILKNLLTHENSLLLSGKPRVGKSYTAMWIAASFQDQGYRVKRTDDIFEAFRFLEDPVDGPRLVIVDDPLGGSRLANNPHQIWQELKNKLPYVPSTNRKIIISQGQERLLEISGQSQLQDIRVAAKRWNDLSSYPESFLEKFWEQSNERTQLPEELYFTVLTNLSSGLSDIELGSLEYLLTEYEKIKPSSNVDEIMRFSRKSSSDLGRALDDEGHKPLLVGLALTTNGLNPIHETELSYVLQNKADKEYGYSKILAIGSSFGNSKKTDVQQFPVYSSNTDLSEEYVGSLDKLEDKKMTKWDDDDKISFTHPFYRAAAESIINTNSRSNWKSLLAHLSNGIFCLSPATSTSTAKNLRWIYHSSDKQKFKEEIVDLAIEGLSSSYPSTRDVCFDTLIAVAPELNKKHLEKQAEWLSSVSFSSLADANWHNGYPWYPMGEDIVIDTDVFKSLGIFEVSEQTADTLESLNSKQFFDFTPKVAFDALNYCRRNPKDLHTIGMMRMLSLDEGQIRALATKIWLGENRANDETVLHRIFNDKHPSVAEAVYETIVANWDDIEVVRRKQLLSNLKVMVESPLASAIILPELLQFNRVEVTGSNPPWQIFFCLLPTVLRNVHRGVFVRFGRLDNVVHEALEAYGYEPIIPIISEWVELIRVKDSLGDGGGYDTAVTKYIMDLPEVYSEFRQRHIELLLRVNSTERSTDILSTLIASWSKLTEEERSLIKKSLLVNRDDQKWLHATVLVRDDAPKSLTQLVMKDNVLELSLEELQSLDTSFLEILITTYFDRNGASVPTESSHRNVWHELLLSILYNPAHPLYLKCFRYLIKYRENDLIISSSIKCVGTKYLSQIFEILLAYAVYSCGEYRPLAWAALLGSAPDESMRNSWLIKMAETSGLYLDTISEIDEWLPAEYIDSFYDYMYPDNLLLNLFKNLKDQGTSMERGIIDSTVEIVEAHPPFHFQTCDYICHVLIRLNGSEDQRKRVMKIRDNILSNRREIFEEMMAENKRVAWVP
ncbi:nSTAND3 domain-containing NTPase [Photobacterium leiognathi]|uniref:nSTAND3 domain-containing NTPase n=1 Tax=Photobacterium leiognathi TaxID=553611 RepID=UPI002981F862|nr:hypothetical protein [Photobacterium leiognathi]